MMEIAWCFGVEPWYGSRTGALVIFMFRDVVLYAAHLNNMMMSLCLLSAFLTSNRVALLFHLQSGYLQAASPAPWYGTELAFGTATTFYSGGACGNLSASGERKETLSSSLLIVEEKRRKCLQYSDSGALDLLSPSLSRFLSSFPSPSP
jgi:hypothetical protein